MPRNILIGAFGGGPGIITSLLDCFWEIHQLRFEKVILVTTDSQIIHQGYAELQNHLAQSDCPICVARQHTDVEVCLEVVQGVAEIVTEPDINKLVSKFLGQMRRESQPDTNIYLCLSGGRRNMIASTVFAGMLFPVVGLYDATPKKRILGHEVKQTREAWNTLSDDEKKALWEEEKALLRKIGLQTEQIDKPPPTFGWHYNVKEDFNLVRLPFIGLTPFFEALTQIIRFQQGAHIKDREIKNWFDNMQNDSNFTSIIHYFSKVIGAPIDQLTPTEILKLQQLDNPFWHDCIKWGTKEGIKADALKKRWEKWKMIFTMQKVADMLFDEFDKLFKQSLDEVSLRKTFESLHQQFNRKIIQTLNVRSQSLVELIKDAGSQARERWKKSGGTSKSAKFLTSQIADIKSLSPNICVDGDFAVMLMELIHNAIKFADKTYEVEVTSQHIAIRNDGAPFDQADWEKSLKSKRYPDICFRHLLEFNIGQCPNGKGTEIKISGYDIHRAALKIPINACDIYHAKDYE
ncbi:TPA: hypothetical protein EYP66_18005 [Candidatus Poribacteria bacterium]|nr:hypothetical protein [Candidatus Poribacteria bacterium]